MLKNNKSKLIAVLVFIGSFLLLAPVAFFLTILFLGPHSDILPSVLKLPVGVLLFGLAFGVPFWLARFFGRKKDNIDEET